MSGGYSRYVSIDRSPFPTVSPPPLLLSAIRPGLHTNPVPYPFLLHLLDLGEGKKFE